MILLAVDIGNTNVVCACFEDDVIGESCRMASDLNFYNKLRNFESKRVEGVVISSVVPRLTDIYVEACRNLFHLEPICVSADNAGVTLSVDSPDEVGADRICNVAASLELYGAPGVVVDFGTATTYDVIDKSGAFIGGAIAPGMDVSANYLFKKAALLRETAFTIPGKAVGQDTATNLQSGIMFGAIDAVQGMIARIQKELDIERITTVLTGGFSQLISPGLTIKHHLAPQLTMAGMRLIYERNTAK